MTGRCRLDLHIRQNMPDCLCDRGSPLIIDQLAPAEYDSNLFVPPGPYHGEHSFIFLSAATPLQRSANAQGRK